MRIDAAFGESLPLLDIVGKTINDLARNARDLCGIHRAETGRNGTEQAPTGPNGTQQALEQDATGTNRRELELMDPAMLRNTP